MPGVEHEYVAALAREPALGGGKVAVRFVIMADGSVGRAEVLDDTLECPRLAAAIIHRVSGWRFPPIPHGVATVDYPFIFIAPANVEGEERAARGP